jgi:hypothetical protein
MMITLPSSGFDVLGKRLSTYVAAPSGIADRGFTERGICTGGTDWNSVSIIGTSLVTTGQYIRGRKIGCHALDLFHDAEVAFEWEFFAAGCAEAARNTRIA